MTVIARDKRNDTSHVRFPHAMPRISESTIAAVRQFNRFYTRTIGALGEGHLGSPFNLTEVRVLFELAHRAAPTATELSAAVGLDMGYLSRILRRFERLRLISRSAAVEDRRRSAIRLTGAGRKAFAPLNRKAGVAV